MRWLYLPLSLALTIASHAGGFEIINVQEEIPESNPVTRTRVLEEKLEFSFIAPPRWTSVTDASARRYTLQSPTNQLVLAVRLTTNAYPASAEKFKEVISSQFLDVSSLETFETANATGPGWCADFRHVVGGNYKVNSRVAIFPAPEGSVEVSFSSPQIPMEKLHDIWAGFVGSVRVETRARPRR